jgi:hypothetical protein
MWGTTSSKTCREARFRATHVVSPKLRTGNLATARRAMSKQACPASRQSRLRVQERQRTAAASAGLPRPVAARRPTVLRRYGSFGEDGLRNSRFSFPRPTVSAAAPTPLVDVLRNVTLDCVSKWVRSSRSSGVQHLALNG